MVLCGVIINLRAGTGTVPSHQTAVPRTSGTLRIQGTTEVMKGNAEHLGSRLLHDWLCKHFPAYCGTGRVAGGPWPKPD
jgi:hypothetical protein